MLKLLRRRWLLLFFYGFADESEKNQELTTMDNNMSSENKITSFASSALVRSVFYEF